MSLQLISLTQQELPLKNPIWCFAAMQFTKQKATPLSFPTVVFSHSAQCHMWRRVLADGHLNQAPASSTTLNFCNDASKPSQGGHCEKVAFCAAQLFQCSGISWRVTLCGPSHTGSSQEVFPPWCTTQWFFTSHGEATVAKPFEQWQNLLLHGTTQELSLEFSALQSFHAQKVPPLEQKCCFNTLHFH